MSVECQKRHYKSETIFPLNVLVTYSICIRGRFNIVDIIEFSKNISSSQAMVARRLKSFKI